MFLLSECYRWEFACGVSFVFGACRLDLAHEEEFVEVQPYIHPLDNVAFRKNVVHV